MIESAKLHSSVYPGFQVLVVCPSQIFDDSSKGGWLLTLVPFHLAQNSTRSHARGPTLVASYAFPSPAWTASRVMQGTPGPGRVEVESYGVSVGELAGRQSFLTGNMHLADRGFNSILMPLSCFLGKLRVYPPPTAYEKLDRQAWCEEMCSY